MVVHLVRLKHNINYCSNVSNTTHLERSLFTASQADIYQLAKYEGIGYQAPHHYITAKLLSKF